MTLDAIKGPEDLQGLTHNQLQALAQEIRDLIISTVTTTGGHLGSNLGVVELTLALHRVFHSPEDILLWDTGHQAYTHKLITGRRDEFASLRQRGGLSGYPNRAESPHDWIESSHASTALSYAHGLAIALDHRGELAGHGGKRHVVAVVGDGSLTGGMAYEALNNLGHSNQRVVIVLNDNGRSYAPTVSKLSESLTSLRLNRTYVSVREGVRHLAPHLPRAGRAGLAGLHGMTSAVRDLVTPGTFFEDLGVRYVGPIDGHNIESLETTLRNAALWDGPIVVHILTEKGRGYEPATTDKLKMHDFKLRAVTTDDAPVPESFTAAFANSLITLADLDDRDRGDHGRDGRTDGPRSLPGALSDAVLRRGHRRTARGHCGRGHGDGRAQTGGRRSTRPSSHAPSTRRTSTSGCSIFRSSSSLIVRALPVTTGRATTDSSTWRCVSRFLT